eukprot:scaffold10883_cov74-Phaeocystis_antarctica.AAC.5
MRRPSWLWQQRVAGGGAARKRGRVHDGAVRGQTITEFATPYPLSRRSERSMYTSRHTRSVRGDTVTCGHNYRDRARGPWPHLVAASVSQSQAAWAFASMRRLPRGWWRAWCAWS